MSIIPGLRHRVHRKDAEAQATQHATSCRDPENQQRFHSVSRRCAIRWPLPGCYWSGAGIDAYFLAEVNGVILGAVMSFGVVALLSLVTESCSSRRTRSTRRLS